MNTQLCKEFECLFDPFQVKIDREGSGVESFLASIGDRFGFQYEAGSEQVDNRQVSKYDTQDVFLTSNGLHAKFITYANDGK